MNAFFVSVQDALLRRPAGWRVADALIEERRKRLEGFIDTWREKWEAREIQQSEFERRSEDWLRELSYIANRDLISYVKDRGIEIPEQHWLVFDTKGRTTLSNDGIALARRKKREYKRDELRFYVGMLSPILALIVSIMGLTVAYQKNMSRLGDPCPATEIRKGT